MAMQFHKLNSKWNIHYIYLIIPPWLLVTFKQAPSIEVYHDTTQGYHLTNTYLLYFLFYISLYHRDCFMVFSSFSHRDAVVNSPLHVPEQTSTGSKGRRQPQHPRHQQASACPVVKWLWRFLICDLKTWDNQTWGFIVDIIDFRWPWEIGFWRIWGESTVIIWIFLIINVSRWVFNL
jgi:hypothetical protein